METIKGQLTPGRFIVPYRAYGESENVIICISGAKQTMAVWRSFVSHFIADYTVVVFDMPGQGRSTIVSGSPGIAFDEQIEVLLAVVNATSRDKKVILAAASWGTIVSVALAARYPELVHKMILGSFGARPSRAMMEIIREGQRLFNEDNTGDIAPMMIEKFGQYIPESQKQQMIAQFRNMSREQFLSFYEHCEFVGQSTSIEEFIELGNIEASTLIVTGEYDAILDNKDVEQTSTRIPDCEFRMIPGAGHFLHWEQSDILHTYSEFLAR